MATAFGAKRPKIGRTVEDIARMSPEERRELQDEIHREYVKRFLGLWDATAAARRFAKDAESAGQRQARPSPFGGGAEPFGGTIGGSPIQIGAAPAGVPVRGVLPYPPYPPERGAYTLDFEMTAPSPSGSLPPLGPGGPLGVSRPTLPGTLPVSEAGLPLGPQTGTPGAGFGTGAVGAPGSQPAAPATAGVEGGGGGFDPKIAAMLLASVSDAVKENLTLQGARGAKGTAAPNLLQMMEQERIAKRDEMDYRLKLSEWLAQEPERRMKAMTGFADLAAKMSGPFATSDPDEQKVMMAGLEQMAEQSGLPRSLVGKYLKQGQAALESVRDLLPHLKDNPAALQVIMMRSWKLLDEGKFQATVQEAANHSIRRKINEQLPNVLASLDKQSAYQGKDKPEDLVNDLVAGGDKAILDYLTGATAPKDEHDARRKRWAGMGVAMPETKAEIRGAVEKQAALLPGEVEKAKQTAEVTEPSRLRVSQQQGVAAKELELNQPLSAKDRSNYVDVRALTEDGLMKQPPAGTTRREADQSEKYVHIDDKQKERLTGLNGALSVVDQIDALSRRVITAATPVDAAIQGAAKNIEARIKTDPIAASFRDSRQAFVGNLNRVLGAERGVLTDRDILRMAAALPNFGDTKQIRDLKIAIIRDIWKANQGSVVAEVSGQSPKQIRSRIDELLDQLDAAGKPGGGTTPKILGIEKVP